MVKRNVVLVCGPRYYDDRRLIWRTLDLFHADQPFTLLVQGYARGVDRLAHKWALSRGVPSTGKRYAVTPAMWEQQGKAAGVVRNLLMRDKELPDKVIAFLGDEGPGRGTSHMIASAEAKSKWMMLFKVDGKGRII